MSDDTAVDDADLARSQASASAQRDRRDEVEQHTDCQQDLEREQSGKAAVERPRQDITISPGHRDTGTIEDGQDEGHQAPETTAHLDLEQAHRPPTQRLAQGFNHEDFEEHRADESDGRKEVQGNEEKTIHGTGVPRYKRPQSRSEPSSRRHVRDRASSSPPGSLPQGHKACSSAPTITRNTAYGVSTRSASAFGRLPTRGRSGSGGAGGRPVTSRISSSSRASCSIRAATSASSACRCSCSRRLASSWQS